MNDGMEVGRVLEDLNHAWLVERFKARAAEHPRSTAFAYETGRIDEFCGQNGVTAEEREAAMLAAYSAALDAAYTKAQRDAGLDRLARDLNYTALVERFKRDIAFCLDHGIGESAQESAWRTAVES